jgi:uncharacterized repeat protein (TIGR03833 family)
VKGVLFASAERAYLLCKPFYVKEIIMNGNNRSAIRPGTHVQVVQKQDQGAGKLSEGIVKDILTKSSHHPHGIKVRLESGIVGRVKEILDV